MTDGFETEVNNGGLGRIAYIKPLMVVVFRNTASRRSSSRPKNDEVDEDNNDG